LGESAAVSVHDAEILIGLIGHVAVTGVCSVRASILCTLPLRKRFEPGV
jgi:hypothetical protein